MKYCRLQTKSGPQYAEVSHRNGTLWIERLLPPFEEDPWTKFVAEEFTPIPLESATHCCRP